jgi:hypothetical protein
LRSNARAADDLEHVGSSGLLPERFAQLIEQACVLDGDDRLRREIHQQFDLPVREWPYLLAINDNCAYQLGLVEHGHDDMRSRAGRVDKRDDAGVPVEIALVLTKVADVDDLFGFGDTVERSARLIAHDDQRFLPEPVGIAGLAVHRHRTKVGPLSQEQISHLGFADTSGILQHGLEHQLEVPWRARNDAQHFGCGGLLLQRFAQFVEQPGILDGNDGLAAKFCSSAICLSVNGLISCR